MGITFVDKKQDYEPTSTPKTDDGAYAELTAMEAALVCRRATGEGTPLSDLDAMSDTVESLEWLREQMASGGDDPASRRLSTLIIKSHLSVFNMPTPSTESISLEALDDILATMSSHVEAGFGQLRQSLLAVLGHLAGSLPSLEARWRALERKLYDEAKDPEGVVKSNGIISALHRQGIMPSDMEHYLTQYANHVETIATTFDHAAQSAIVHNSDLLASIEFQSVDSFSVSYDHAAKQWSDPRDLLHEAIYEFVVPGSCPFFMDVGSRYKGGNAAIQYFDRYSSKHVPAKGRWGMSFRKVENRPTLEPLRLAEMRELTKVYLAVTEKIKLEAKSRGEALAHAHVKAEFFGKRRDDADSSVRRSMNEPYRYISRAYGICQEMGTHFKYDVLHHFVKVSHALMTYIERSLKATPLKDEHAE